MLQLLRFFTWHDKSDTSLLFQIFTLSFKSIFAWSLKEQKSLRITLSSTCLFNIIRHKTEQAPTFFLSFLSKSKWSKLQIHFLSSLSFFPPHLWGPCQSLLAANCPDPDSLSLSSPQNRSHAAVLLFTCVCFWDKCSEGGFCSRDACEHKGLTPPNRRPHPAHQDFKGSVSG